MGGGGLGAHTVIQHITRTQDVGPVTRLSWLYCAAVLPSFLIELGLLGGPQLD